MARVRQIGFQAWIDEQLKRPASSIVTPPDLINFDQNADQARNSRMWVSHNNALFDMAVGADDQLRYRVTWVLSNFLVTSTRRISPYGGSEYWNTLMGSAFGSYGALLKSISLSPAMGNYLDNDQNTKSSLNENYGRELMQLFSVGMVLLNPDGTVKRDTAGKPIETYSQRDVIEITRALTGWTFVPLPEAVRTIRNNPNWANFGVTMAPRHASQHDTDAKVVLGKTIPAGGDAARDLDAVVEILMNHPNTAPFVSLRLIQGLTTSDPSPGYLGRVSNVFTQTKGDLAAVVRAILLDSEARSGDVPGKGPSHFGRIREPFLLHTSVLRGMGCRLATRRANQSSEVNTMTDKRPLYAESVFNFYPPNHRAPGSNLLAPEQKSLLSSEFSGRLGRYGEWQDEQLLLAAGCDIQPFVRAIAKSDDALLDLLSERYFRGAMSGPVRQGLKDGLAGQRRCRFIGVDRGSSSALVTSGSGRLQVGCHCQLGGRLRW
ncbi:MAG: DUF1800 family protein [Betaproteobacteria bacterium]|nr:DUF1800 family protein [Betaproteobacteria bacterium]